MIVVHDMPGDSQEGEQSVVMYIAFDKCFIFYTI